MADEQLKNKRLPDPLREIARFKKMLNPKSSVALSPYVDIIISMRMQGVNYQAIEKWLEEQGADHRIPASTIFRNMKNLQIDLPYIEEMAERWGGRIDLDLARELAGQFLAQRNRVDRLQRREEEIQEENAKDPNLKGTPQLYHDRRIRSERELLMMMGKELHAMMKNPLEAAKEAVAADQMTNVHMSDKAKETLTELVLKGDIDLGSIGVAGHS